MLTAMKCRELARVCRQQANHAASPRTAKLLQNIGRSLSGLASQLDALGRDEQSSYTTDRTVGVQADAPETMMSFDAMANAVDWLDAYRAADLDLMVSLYAEDATIHCTCGMEDTITGKASIRSYWREQLQKNSAPELGDLHDAGNEARMSYITAEGAVSAVFEFDWDGKITFMRCGPPA